MLNFSSILNHDLLMAKYSISYRLANNQRDPNAMNNDEAKTCSEDLLGRLYGNTPSGAPTTA